MTEDKHEIKLVFDTSEDGSVTKLDVQTTIPHDDVVLYWLVTAQKQIMDKMYAQYKKAAN